MRVAHGNTVSRLNRLKLFSAPRNASSSSATTALIQLGLKSRARTSSAPSSARYASTWMLRIRSPARARGTQQHCQQVALFARARPPPPGTPAPGCSASGPLRAHGPRQHRQPAGCLDMRNSLPCLDAPACVPAWKRRHVQPLHVCSMGAQGPAWAGDKHNVRPTAGMRKTTSSQIPKLGLAGSIAQLGGSAMQLRKRRWTPYLVMIITPITIS